jgi:hypothetical protein
MKKKDQLKITDFLKEQSPSISAKSLRYFSIKDEISFSQFNSRNLPEKFNSGKKMRPLTPGKYEDITPMKINKDYMSIFNRIGSFTNEGQHKFKKERRNLKSVGYKAQIGYINKYNDPSIYQAQSPSCLLGGSVSEYITKPKDINLLREQENLQDFRNKVMKGLEDLKMKLKKDSQGKVIDYIDDMMGQLENEDDPVNVEKSIFQVLQKIEEPSLKKKCDGEGDNSNKENKVEKRIRKGDKNPFLGKRSNIMCFFKKNSPENMKKVKIEEPKPKKQRIDQMILGMKTKQGKKSTDKLQTQTRMDRFLVEKRSNKNVKICSLSKLIWIRIMPYLRLSDMARLASTCHFFKDLYRLFFFKMGSFLNIFDSEAHSEKEIQEIYQKSKSHSHRILRQFFIGKNSKSVLARTKLRVGFSPINRKGHSFNQLSVGPKSMNRRVNTTLLTDSDLAQIVSVSHYSLLDLSLDACLMVSHRGFKSISKLKKLISLRINMNANLRDEHVKDILFNCRFLKKLELTNCSRLTEVSVQHITSFGNKIDYLNLSYNMDLFNDYDGFGFFQRITRLRHLQLIRIDLTNDQILDLIQNCPNLSYLNCQGNKRINSKLIKMVEDVKRRVNLTINVKSTRIPQSEIIVKGCK